MTDFGLKGGSSSMDMPDSEPVLSGTLFRTTTMPGQKTQRTHTNTTWQETESLHSHINLTHEDPHNT